MSQTCVLVALVAMSLHASISGGVGSAFDYAGVRAELRVGHVAVSAAFGTSGVGLIDPDRPTRNVDHMPALGLRFFPGDGERFVAAVAWTGHRYERSYDDGPGCSSCYDTTARLDTFAGTAGWRFRTGGGFYLEAGIGLAVATRSGHPSVSGHDSIPGPFKRVTLVIPDAVLAAGLEF